MTISVLEPLMEMTRRTLKAAIEAASEAANSPVQEVKTPFFAVDATAGNGHDTLFLAREVGDAGRVFAFDIQKSAIDNAHKRIAKAGLEKRVTFINAGHETAETALPPEVAGNLWAVTFNLGYLPGSDKERVTSFATTIAALKTLTAFAAPGCVISVHAYRGHDGGEDEFRHVAAWLRELPWEVWRVAEYSFINKRKNKETLFLLEKTHAGHITANMPDNACGIGKETLL